jgi:hypothetical protein
MIDGIKGAKKKRSDETIVMGRHDGPLRLSPFGRLRAMSLSNGAFA